ncbi:AAA family ATPase [Christiangramia marina]|uniref:AAA family ATPase n=1 Tax=Christiangramia marina TaxID=409436 RepID=UPI003AA86F0B
MFLEEIIIHNYRSCKSIVLNLSENNPNIFIGLNDSGKSTLLQSLDLLLGDKTKFSTLCEGNYKSDISNTPEQVEVLNKILSEKKLPDFDDNDNGTYVIGKLRYKEGEAEEYTNLNLSTPLTWSLECNENGIIWLAKKFSKVGGRTFLLMKDSDKKLELWNLNQANINKKIKEFGVTGEDIDNDNNKGRFSNLEKIRAIYSKTGGNLKWTEYRYAKNDRDIFPSFSLFDWNTSLDEVISTANVIMKEEIDVHLTPIKDQAAESAKKAEKAINKKFGEISKVIKEVAKDVESINSKVYFDVKEKISDIMVTKAFSDGPIHLENQGEGLKRQIWFSLIKAKADSSSDSLNKFIWAFDEPETHLYPRAQREFFDTLNKVSKGNVQTLISTHSTIFIDKSNFDKINSVIQESDGYSTINNCRDVEAIYSSLNVKNSDFLFFDKFLIVEGDTEQHLIPRLYEIYTGKTLIKDNIQLINIQGKDKYEINKKILDKIMSGFKKSEDQIVYLFDNDMSFVMGQAAIKENMFFVGYQDIEDSIDNEIWLNILNDFYNEELEFSLEEIEKWKANVVKKTKCAAREKFYPLMKNGIKMKCGNDVDYDSLEKLPSKGNDSADLLLKYIDHRDKIPNKIKEAFDKLID